MNKRHIEVGHIVLRWLADSFIEALEGDDTEDNTQILANLYSVMAFKQTMLGCHAHSICFGKLDSLRTVRTTVTINIESPGLRAWIDLSKLFCWQSN